VVGAGLVTLVVLGCGEDLHAADPAPPPATGAPEAPAVRYVGSARCAACHATQTERWRGSHHDRAMEEATASSVLGDFDDASFSHLGRTTRFFQREGRPFVETEGPDGKRAQYEVAWTFGVEPLQQYLLPLPGGRLQALDVAWDSRPEAEGGGAWFSLRPDEAIPPDDVLHWTKLSQRWNAMCVDCHSTGVRRGYVAEGDRYETSFAEVDVACEACHGPGSRHVAWAESGGESAAGDGGAFGAAYGLAVDLSGDGGRWELAPGAAIAHRVPPRDGNAEVEVCSPCHSRRSALTAEPEPGAAFLDGYRPALLEAGLYHADGQILDEVYVWGSFLQSRMHAAGVSCGDCHDPHSLAVADPPDATCNRCHEPEVFATPAHHHHPAGSAGASCLGCHMPARTYMEIDVRRDHSFRVPRPDLSVEIGTPNACSDCHAERTSAWAASAALGWWGPERASQPHYGELLHAGRSHAAQAGAGLVALAGDPEQPAIVRATALRLLRENPDPGVPAALEAALRDPDPVVRMAAVGASEVLPPERALGLVAPALRDPSRAVRLTAAPLLAGAPSRQLDDATRNALADALAEYRAAQLASADRPEAQVNLGLLHARFGELEQARAAYQRALALAPWFVPASINLADLERSAGREAEAEALLRRALTYAPEQASLHHSLGLSLVRQQRLEEALGSLARAAELEPETPRYAYVHGVALHSTGQGERALAVLGSAHERHPTDAALLSALATLSRDAGNLEAARRHAHALAALRPDDPDVQRLLAELEAPARAPSGSAP
jgi:Flp pilus assembly protein TadD